MRTGLGKVFLCQHAELRIATMRIACRTCFPGDPPSSSSCVPCWPICHAPVSRHASHRGSNCSSCRTWQQRGAVMASSENYFRVAISNESAIVAAALSSTRNHALNRAAFKLGTIPGMTTDTAMNALLLAAGANGYIKEHGESAARKVIESGLRNGQSNPRPPSQSRPSQRFPSRQLPTVHRK